MSLQASGSASTKLLEHDPLAIGESSFGPYAQGEPLGLTMGECLYYHLSQQEKEPV